MRAKKLHQGIITSAVLLALAGTKPLIAATYVWTGGGNDPYWNYRSFDGTYSNWGDSATLPGSSDDVVFGDGFGSGTPLLDSGTFSSLTIDTSAPIELDGSGVTLTSGNLFRTATSSGIQTINMSFYVTGATVWDLQGSGGVSAFSAFFGSNNSSFTKTGAADLNVEGGLLFNGPVTVAGGNLTFNGGQGFATFQGNDGLLITNQGANLLVENSGSLTTQGQPRIDNGGAVTISGSNSNWSNYDTVSSQGNILVGRDGTGVLTISNNGHLTTSNLTLGSQPSGTGTLNVTGGGQLATTNLSAGGIGGGAASIAVTGTGSIANTENLTLGTGAPASLFISAGGAVNVLPTSPSNIGTLNLGSVAGITIDGGSLTAQNITGQGQINLKSDPTGSAALTINPYGLGPIAIQAKITGAGSVNIPWGDVQFINCSNTYTGQTYVSNAVAEYDGGSNSSSFSLGLAGWVFFNNGVVLNLGSGSITAGDASSLAVYSDVTVNGGTLIGPSHQVTNATFNGTTIASGALFNITSVNQQCTLNSVVISGLLNDGGNLAMNGVGITSTGTVRILVTGQGISVTSNGLQNSGKLSIGSGTLSNSGTDLQLGAGSQTLISPGAAISLTGGTAISARSASLINDGVIEGPSNIYSGSVAGGSGQYNGSLNVFAGGRVWPGDGVSSPARIASLTSTSSAWNDGGIFHWEISASTGTPGANWDLWNAGTTSITSTGMFDVEIESVGSLPDWSASTGHSWLIATSDNGAFTLDALSHLSIFDDGFTSANDLAGGSLSLTDSADGADLYLTFTPAPEPGAMACLTLGAGGLLLRRRKGEA